MEKSVVAALALLVSGGCYTVSYQTRLGSNGECKEDRGDFFLWGLVGDKTVDLKELCPTGVSRWKSQATFVDGLLSVVTFGIYVPRHVKVECASGAAYWFELDAPTATRLSSAPSNPHVG